jgi:protein-arginine kinase activator protein McsA
VYEQFTDRARKVLQLANQEAHRFNHEYVGSEHILLGLVKEGSGVGAHALKNLRLDLRKIRLAVEKTVQSGQPTATLGNLARTPRTKKVLEYAKQEARTMGHRNIGTEHLLLGLLREPEGVAGQVLANVGLNVEDVRQAVRNLVAQSDRLSVPRIEEAKGQDLSGLPAEVQHEVIELDRQISQLNVEIAEAVAAQYFEKAAWTRDRRNPLVQKRNTLVRLGRELEIEREIEQRIAEMTTRIEALLRAKEIAVTAGDFVQAAKIADKLDRVRERRRNLIYDRF